jgi:hypothetical protein
VSWSIGFDERWARDIGYGVPAICDHPNCSAEIDRGLSYVCGGEPYGGDRGCGLYFCSEHQVGSVWRGKERLGSQLCCRCYPRIKKPFTAKPDVRQWIEHKLTDESWEPWRTENPEEVAVLRAALQAEPA